MNSSTFPSVDRTIYDYTKAIELYPDFAHAYYRRGVAYHEKGDDEKAIEDFTVAADLDPKNALAFFMCAQSYTRKGDHEKASSRFGEAKRLLNEP